jgi:hypothetical protein
MVTRRCQCETNLTRNDQAVIRDTSATNDIYQDVRIHFPQPAKTHQHQSCLVVDRRVFEPLIYILCCNLLDDMMPLLSSLSLCTVINSYDHAGSNLPPLFPSTPHPAIHTLRIPQSILTPLRLQVTPVLAKVKASLVLSVRKQSRIAQLRAGVCLCPQSDSDGVGALVIDYTWREGEACLRTDLRDVFAIYGGERRGQP